MILAKGNSSPLAGIHKYYNVSLNPTCNWKYIKRMLTFRLLYYSLRQSIHN